MNNNNGFTMVHLAAVAIAATLAGVATYVGHCSEVTQLAAMIIGGVFGHAQGQKGQTGKGEP